MLRYIAFIRRHRVRRDTDEAREQESCLIAHPAEFRCVFNTDGLRIYQSIDPGYSGQAYPLGEKSGVLLGKLFRTSGEPAAVNRIRSTEAATIGATMGRSILREYWGHYVAFVRNRKDGSIRVIRDPTGAAPCHWLRLPGMDVLYSHLADCLSLGLVNPSIDWDHVIQFLAFHRLVTPETGLVGIRQVQAGECVTFKEHSTDATFYWTPGAICETQTLEEKDHAMDLLRSTVLRVIASWAGCYGTILHELSGGLDSTLVLSCLTQADSRPSVIAQNVYSEEGEGDERTFARVAAMEVAVELVETPLRVTDRPFDRILSREPVATPALTELVLEDPSRKKQLIAQKQIQAVFSGQGGDHLFQRRRTPLIAAEYLSRRGLRLPLLQVITDTARLTRTSVWAVGIAAIAHGFGHRVSELYRDRLTESPLVHDSCRDAINIGRLHHPWLNQRSHLPAAKLLQVLSVIDSQNFHRIPSPGVDLVHPLISQPIVEACLAIPSYVLSYGGIDRALVRESFQDLLPPLIFQRTTKGGTTGYVCKYLIHWLTSVREFLLDGLLAKNGILDPQKVEMHLSEARLTRDGSLVFPILDSLRAEGWARTLASESSQARS